MTTTERTWDQYALAANILYTLANDLEDVDWDCRLTFGDAPRLDIGTAFVSGNFLTSFTLTVDMGKPFLTFRMDLPDGESMLLGLQVDSTPDPDHVEALRREVMSITNWSVEDTIQALLNGAKPVLARDWDHVPESEHTWVYTSTLPNGDSVDLTIDPLPAALSATLEIQKDGVDARTYDMIVRHDTDLTDACETLIACLEDRPHPLAEALLNRLGAALPAEWAPVDSGRGTWYLGPADGDPAPYELDFDDDPDGVYVALSYWSEDDLPCDCCDAQFGYNQLIGDVVTADNMDDVIESILREIRITHDV